MSITVPLVWTAAVIIENPPGNPSPVPCKLRLALVQFVLGSALCPAKFSPKDFGRAEAAVPALRHPRVTHVTLSPVTSHSSQGALSPSRLL